MNFAQSMIKRLYAGAAFGVVLATVFILASVAALSQDSGEENADGLGGELIKGLDQFLGSSFSLKIWIVAAFAIAGITLYLRNRDTPGNNIRRARAFHRKGMTSHERGDGEEASEYYRKSAAFREKAEVQE